MVLRRIVLALLIGLVALPAFGQETLDWPLAEPQTVFIDSGPQQNGFLIPRTVWSNEVTMPDAAWMRLYFGQIGLPPGSFIRITSNFDGAVQELDAAGLEMWSDSTAYFNGDSLDVELIAAPGSRNNRLVIDRIASETHPAIPAGSCGICGPDDRVLSDVDFAARLLPAGCSGTIFNTDSCYATAGHCVGGNMVIQFNVPASNANCSLNNPPPEDQFPITSFLFTNAGIGNDWAVMTVGTNNLGEKPIDRYGEFRPLASTPPSVGQDVAVWGYGVDSECTKSQVQQFHDGNITQVSSNSFRYDVDVTFGNSGSGVIRAGELLGVVTHCPCPAHATRVDQASFAAALDQLCPVTAEPQDAPLSAVNVIVGDYVSGGLAELSGDDTDYVVVDSAASGSRHNAITEVIAESPLSVASELRVKVTVGPATDSPVFFTVGLFDNDAGHFAFLDFVVATAGDTAINLNLANPTKYIDGSGNVVVRVAQTARLAQIPGGFTKLIDEVDVSVVP